MEQPDTGGCGPTASSSPQNSVAPFGAVPGGHRSLSRRHLCLPLVPSCESVLSLCPQSAHKGVGGRARGSDAPQMLILLSKRSKGTLLFVPIRLNIPQTWLSFSILLIPKHSTSEMSRLNKMASFNTN